MFGKYSYNICLNHNVVILSLSLPTLILHIRVKDKSISESEFDSGTMYSDNVGDESGLNHVLESLKY